jgi:Ni,Fe-hydrogenase III small subunit
MGILDDAFLKSLWVFHLATGSCNNCDIEILDCLTPRHDIERFGMLLTGSIKHADVLLVTGAVNRQCIPRIKRIYEQMPQPRLVSYNCPLPLDHVIPVDVYIPGCPPRPEAIIAGLIKLIEQRKTQTRQAKA